MSYEGRCMAPKDPRPGVTTYFCVYEEGHEGDHSWEHTEEVRVPRIRRAEKIIREINARRS